MSSDRLPRIRLNLDFMPSPIADRPGLLIRDPFRYSDITAIIPDGLLPCLRFFDGTSGVAELKVMLRRITASPDVDELAAHLVETLSGAAFLEDDVYRAAMEARHVAFAGAESRPAVHAGTSYPEAAASTRAVLEGYLQPDGTEAPSPAAGSSAPLVGIAAPHVSPDGGWRSYAAAYRALTPDLADRTFVILGTSHYGQPERYGLTRKPFVTPLGTTTVDVRLVNELADAAPDAVMMEDYCHAIEHSIEFQVIFLQHLYGPAVRILPILCGAFARSLDAGGLPTGDEGVARFIGALGNIHAREKERLFHVLGIDMAHIGRRYGDPAPAVALAGDLLLVESRDRERLEQVNAGNAAAFWELVVPNGDDLKWCGASPLYTFLEAVPEARGTLLRYEQWNIDDASVVSFAGLSFRG